MSPYHSFYLEERHLTQTLHQCHYGKYSYSVSDICRNLPSEKQLAFSPITGFMKTSKQTKRDIQAKTGSYIAIHII